MTKIQIVIPPIRRWEFTHDEDTAPSLAAKYWRDFEFKWANWLFNKENKPVKAYLNSRTPAEWAEAVEEIDNRYIRNHVASILWWDYFGLRKCNKRWPNLDKYINAPFTKVSIKDTVNGLVQCGLTKDMAVRRARGEDH